LEDIFLGEDKSISEDKSWKKLPELEAGNLESWSWSWKLGKASRAARQRRRLIFFAATTPKSAQIASEVRQNCVKNASKLLQNSSWTDLGNAALFLNRAAALRDSDVHTNCDANGFLFLLNGLSLGSVSHRLTRLRSGKSPMRTKYPFEVRM
jgi:hypothetical protein